jgi:hypothetical protein
MKTVAVALAVALVTASSSTAAFVVTSKNIKNGTIQLVDISPKAKKALRGQRGPQGTQGAQGPQGAQGVQTITEVFSQPTFIPPGQFGTAVATCPDGQQPISGGFEGTTTGMTIKISKRFDRGWGVAGQNSPTGVPGPVVAYVYCSPNVTLMP